MSDEGGSRLRRKPDHAQEESYSRMLPMNHDAEELYPAPVGAEPEVDMWAEPAPAPALGARWFSWYAATDDLAWDGTHYSPAPCYVCKVPSYWTDPQGRSAHPCCSDVEPADNPFPTWGPEPILSSFHSFCHFCLNKYGPGGAVLIPRGRNTWANCCISCATSPKLPEHPPEPIKPKYGVGRFQPKAPAIEYAMIQARDSDAGVEVAKSGVLDFFQMAGIWPNEIIELLTKEPECPLANHLSAVARHKALPLTLDKETGETGYKITPGALTFLLTSLGAKSTDGMRGRYYWFKQPAQPKAVPVEELWPD